MKTQNIRSIFERLAAESEAAANTAPQPQYDWWADTVRKADAFLAGEDK